MSKRELHTLIRARLKNLRVFNDYVWNAFKDNADPHSCVWAVINDLDDAAEMLETALLRLEKDGVQK